MFSVTNIAHFHVCIDNFVIKVVQSYELPGRSRWPCGRLITEIVGSNPAEGMDVRLLCVLCFMYEVCPESKDTSRVGR